MNILAKSKIFEPRLIASVRAKWPRLIISTFVFFTCALSASPSMAGYMAATAGAVTSGPFAQFLTGTLYNQWDPSEAGFAYNLLQEQTVAGYTWTPGAVNILSLAEAFSYQFTLDTPTHSASVSVGATITATFPTPPILYGPFSVQITGNAVPPIPFIGPGPNKGLVAATQAESQVQDLGPNVIDAPPNQVSTPPDPISLLGGVATSDDDGPDCTCYLYKHLWAITFKEEYSTDPTLAEASWTALEGFSIIGDTPNSTVAGGAVFGDDFLLPPGQFLAIRSTVDAEIYTQYVPVPEPASLFLFGSGLLALAGLAAHRSRRTKSRAN